MTNPLRQTEVGPRNSEEFVVDQMSGAIGAVIDGVDLASATAETVNRIREQVVENHVVFVRGQNLDENQFARLASLFGTPSVHPLRTLIGRPQAISVIEDTPSRPPAGFPWHTDLSWLPAPPRFGFLQALEIPEYGGDTLWASLGAAYRNMSPAMQQLCGQLRATHAIDASFKASVVRNHGEDVAAKLELENPPTSHPLVRKHPDTGEPSLWLSPLYTESIVDLMPDESTMLLGHLNRLAEDPNIAVRWHWAEGDIAIWDESCTVHRALSDHHPLSRKMRRCTTEGDMVEKYS